MTLMSYYQDQHVMNLFKILDKLLPTSAIGARTITLNANKSQLVYFSSSTKQIESLLVQINGKSIEQVAQCKFLGVHLSMNLS